jgi:hypothetical protein
MATTYIEWPTSRAAGLALLGEAAVRRRGS